VHCILVASCPKYVVVVVYGFFIEWK